MSKKNPFVNYTWEEIVAIEASSYAIIVGRDVYHEEKGEFIFTRKAVIFKYNKVRRELLDALANGSPKEKRIAQNLLANFKVVPIRIH